MLHAQAVVVMKDAFKRAKVFTKREFGMVQTAIDNSLDDLQDRSCERERDETRSAADGTKQQLSYCLLSWLRLGLSLLELLSKYLRKTLPFLFCIECF
jgi:hypothetical protein